jgi:hypothetical protein
MAVASGEVGCTVSSFLSVLDLVKSMRRAALAGGTWALGGSSPSTRDEARLSIVAFVIAGER